MSKKILALVLALVLVCSLVPSVAAAESGVRFEFGANGNAAHVDGNDLGATKSYTEGGYTLELTGMSKVYGPAFDAKGNSCIKMGTSKLNGSFTFAVPEGINEVVIYAAQYKANKSVLSVNGTEYTLSGASNNGAYDEIVVDTTATKSVTVATVGTTYRAMINAIVFNGEAGATPTPTTPVEPEVTEPEATEPEATEPEATEPATSAPAVGTAYKFGMIQENVSKTDVYYLKGGMDGYYMATSKNVADAIDVYLEETEGGYYLYTMSGDSKLYINMVISGTHVNGAYEATASTVYTYDEEAATVTAIVNDAPYWFGTRNDKTYTTVGPCATSYNGFYCKFYAAEGGEVTPTEPEATEPEATEPAPEGGALTIPEANELGKAQDTGAYTTAKYKVSGTILEIDDTTYGNMTITDGTNTFYIYGTYSADGANRYDAMSVKPVAGDIITVLGIVGNYSGNPQMKNGWIVEHTVGTPAETEPVEAADAEISFADKANRVSQDKEQQVWVQNGITVTNDKDQSVTNVADYAAPARFYKDSKVTIEAANMIKIVIKCNNLTYASQLVASLPAGTAYTQNVSEITIELAEATDSFSVSLTGGQVRVDKIGVFFAKGGAEELKGDIDGNGSVTNEDVVALLWNTLFPEENPINGFADFNGDGSVTNEDVVVLLWHTLFPEENPL